MTSEGGSYLFFKLIFIYGGNKVLVELEQGKIKGNSTTTKQHKIYIYNERTNNGKW